MNKLQRLIEKATQKSEMRWRVFAYDPDKDNELVHKSKDFDCICKAGTAKMEILKDHPNYIVEIIAESRQKNEATFKPGDKVSVKSYYKDGNQFITLRNATIIKEITEKEAGRLEPAYNWKEPTGMKYYLVKLDTGSKKAVLASDLTLESAQKSESKVNMSRQKNEDRQEYFRFRLQTKGEREKLKTLDRLSNIKEKQGYYYVTFLAKTNSAGELAEYLRANKLSPVDLLGVTDYTRESIQKNEDFYKYIDEVPTKEIAKALKELDIKEPYATQKAKIADKLAKRFGLRKVPTPIEMVPILNSLPYFTEAANIDVKNPGVLEVPDGKNVQDLPQSHFEKLVDKKGYAEVIRALTNLEVWNKDKNKSLSSWASNMADKLKKKYRPESAQKNEDKETSLVFELSKLLVIQKNLENEIQRYEKTGKADKDNRLYTAALDKLKSVKSKIDEKKSILNRLKG